VQVLVFVAKYTKMAQKVILQLREEYPASSVDGDAEAGAAAR
jgi:hypothetical protein